jgi:hypothetical protein
MIGNISWEDVIKLGFGISWGFWIAVACSYLYEEKK